MAEQVKSYYSGIYTIFMCQRIEHKDDKKIHVCSYPDFQPENFFKLFCLRCAIEREGSKSKKFPIISDLVQEILQLLNDKENMKQLDQAKIEGCLDLFEKFKQRIDGLQQVLEEIKQKLDGQRDDFLEQIKVNNPEEKIIPLLVSLTSAQKLSTQEKILENLQIYFKNDEQQNLQINYEPLHHAANQAIEDNLDFLRKFNEQLSSMEKEADYCNNQIFKDIYGNGKRSEGGSPLHGSGVQSPSDLLLNNPRSSAPSLMGNPYSVNNTPSNNLSYRPPDDPYNNNFLDSTYPKNNKDRYDGGAPVSFPRIDNKYDSDFGTIKKETRRGQTPNKMNKTSGFHQGLFRRDNEQGCNLFYAGQSKEVRIRFATVEGILDSIENDNPLSGDILSKSLISSSVSENELKFIRSLGNYMSHRISGTQILYRGSAQGFGSDVFHSYCNNQGPTITLIKTTQDFVFGGFTPISWNSTGNWKLDPFLESFLFSINRQGVYFLNNHYQNTAVYHNASFGPQFGGYCLSIADGCNMNSNSFSNLGYSYLMNYGLQYDTIQNKHVLAGQYNFTVREIQVFAVTFV